MKGIILLSTCLFTLSAYASTDASNLSGVDLCKQYGSDLAWNYTAGQSEFLQQVVSRTQNGSWSISTEECNEYIQAARHNANFEIADMLE
ncbi:hypothetical protein OFO16_19065 [Vibrio natriegens]|uniref:hypothetical protein n=1 Tax=Vibrio TaxID=662 RepID=UPI000E487F36|nr:MULTISPECIES: hypothetical protein [Vibrio]AXT73008.1 hypothetical protein DBX26_18820 [Vibrio sp. dhg]UYI50093.1 hypothetical protein OFO16_19065 [Vibrio natriegens]